MSIISSENWYVIFPMWIFKVKFLMVGEFSKVKFLMVGLFSCEIPRMTSSYAVIHVAFTYKISNAIFHIWKSHVKSLIWTFTREIPQFINMSHVEFHVWNFTCENFTCGISHVKFHMWNFTCEISHVKNIVTWETHGFWDSRVLLEVHKWITCESHVIYILISNLHSFVHIPTIHMD